MSLFIDTLTDEVGQYEYGHCFADDDTGGALGCGMEYAYRPDLNRLDHWHDAVGQVTTVTGFTDADRDALDREHAAHVVWPDESGGRLRVRSDGQHEVADERSANEAFGCSRDSECILRDFHDSACNDDREVWAGPDTLYPEED